MTSAASPYFSGQAVTTLAFVATIVVWVGVEIPARLHLRRGSVLRDRGSVVVVAAGVAAGWVLSALAATQLPGTRLGGQPAVFVVGEVVAVTGIAVRGWAIRTLGTSFTVVVRTSPDQPVVTTGPYRWVRHPSYSGLVLVLVGIALLYGTWVGVLATAVLHGLALGYRIRVEERALLADLGPAYRSFAAGRKRLVPGLW